MLKALAFSFKRIILPTNYRLKSKEPASSVALGLKWQLHYDTRGNIPSNRSDGFKTKGLFRMDSTRKDPLDGLFNVLRRLSSLTDQPLLPISISAKSYQEIGSWNHLSSQSLVSARNETFLCLKTQKRLLEDRVLGSYNHCSREVPRTLTA